MIRLFLLGSFQYKELNTAEREVDVMKVLGLGRRGRRSGIIMLILCCVRRDRSGKEQVRKVTVEKFGN
jgi:hypothetical protein